MPQCTWWPLNFDPYTGESISGTTLVLMSDKKCLSPWHLWYIALIKLHSNKDFYHSTSKPGYAVKDFSWQTPTCYGRLNEAPDMYILDPRTHFLPISMHSKYNLSYVLPHAHILWPKNCCTYDFYTDQEKITCFRWFWPHGFSPWPKNDTDLTLNLSLRSNCFWNTDAYKSLSLYNSNERSFVAVCCICHILEQILLPPPHNSYLLQISNVFIYTTSGLCTNLTCKQ